MAYSFSNVNLLGDSGFVDPSNDVNVANYDWSQVDFGVPVYGSNGGGTVTNTTGGGGGVWDVIKSVIPGGMDILHDVYGAGHEGQYHVTQNPDGSYTQNYRLPQQAVTGGLTNMPPISGGTMNMVVIGAVVLGAVLLLKGRG